MDFAWYWSAVAFVTTMASESCALDMASAVSGLGSFDFSAEYTSSGDTCVAVLSMYCSSVPLYSGIRSIEPSFSAGK